MRECRIVSAPTITLSKDALQLSSSCLPTPVTLPGTLITPGEDYVTPTRAAAAWSITVRQAPVSIMARSFCPFTSTKNHGLDSVVAIGPNGTTEASGFQ